MPGRATTFVALLRGINVGGRNRIQMAKLRAICEGIGCQGVETYIQSGNVVFLSALSADALEEQIERAIERDLHLSVPVLVRTASVWVNYVNGNPFPDEVTAEPNRVVLALSRRPPQANAASELLERAASGERVVKKGDAIWIHYPDGIGHSKLTPAVLDRLVGSTVTARNWRTVLTLKEMMESSTAN